MLFCLSPASHQVLPFDICFWSSQQFAPAKIKSRLLGPETITVTILTLHLWYIHFMTFYVVMFKQVAIEQTTCSWKKPRSLPWLVPMPLSREETWWSLGLRRVEFKVNERMQCWCTVLVLEANLNSLPLARGILILYGCSDISYCSCSSVVW